tara:strand:- start:1236 stop:1490 length:255 start_codon:yes stop_codon:yes gene_type:complete
MSLKTIYKTYATIPIQDIGEVDFSQVAQTNADTVRKNIPSTLFILSWNTEPTFIEDGTIIPDGIYTYEEILTLTRQEPWQSNEP